MSNKNYGKEGETIAAEYLTRKGYTILEKNFRTSWGEIDIIAKHKDFLVIVEVKRRCSANFGEPFEAVDLRKQNRLKKIALYYLSKIGREYPLRFDVIAIKGKEIKHIENAFC